ncbi:hypothetical protein [Candidatus Methylobacter favarea]|uniref:hypothetical protein n=1 Tax=Candidatus Methylobacter favarea TaxID=2707345 RepID=UPI00157D9248|nr:hypothetical protein [Candidatus Methylobacter favarea]
MIIAPAGMVEVEYEITRVRYHRFRNGYFADSGLIADAAPLKNRRAFGIACIGNVNIKRELSLTDKDSV